MKKDFSVRSFTDTEFFSGNMFVLSSSEGVIVVDPGCYPAEAREYIQSLGRVDAILLTHAHWDHIRRLLDLKADFPNAPVYLYRGQRDFLTNTELNGSAPQKFDVIVDIDVIELEEGKIVLAGNEIDVIYTPGHTIGECMYYFPEQDILIVGDVLVREVEFGPTFRATGDAEAMKASCKKILAYGIPDETRCCCGHGIDITGTHLKKMFMKAEELVK